MRDEWKNFVASLAVPVEFLHRDDLALRHSLRDIKLPAIFLKVEDGLKEWITQKEINRCHSFEELKRLVGQKLKA